MKKPLVSVCLPIYNAGEYLQDCLDSISSQTLTPIELIAIDDCSTDNSWNILSQFAQNKSWVHIFKNPKNLGVSPTFNDSVSRASSPYIARMDADDIMVKNRLELQKKFLDSHPDTVIVGGQCHLIDRNGKNIGSKTFPTLHKEIYEMLFRTVPMQQPTIMINKSLLPLDFQYGNPQFSPAEDYGLFFAAAQYGKLANLPDFTHHYREHATNISLVRPKFTFWRIWKARLKAVFQQGYQPSLFSAFIVLLQTLVVFLLPSSLIYPLHKRLRGMTSPKNQPPQA